MEIVSFKNLIDFFSFIEFCPICKSRTTETFILPSSVAELSGKELIILAGSFTDDKEPPPIEYDIFWKKFTINLFDNTISSNYSLSDFPSTISLIIGRQCNKYHFHYNGIANISKAKLILDSITLDKYHFIRQLGSNHFTVNNSFSKSATSIRLTTPDFQTREITLPFIEFDLSSKKRIDHKLKSIQLLS